MSAPSASALLVKWLFWATDVKLWKLFYLSIPFYFIAVMTNCTVGLLKLSFCLLIVLTENWITTRPPKHPHSALLLCFFVCFLNVHFSIYSEKTRSNEFCFFVSWFLNITLKQYNKLEGRTYRDKKHEKVTTIMLWGEVKWLSTQK